MWYRFIGAIMVAMSSLPKSLPQVDQIPSPALLIYPDRVRDNIRIMLEIAGDADRLRPHVKTHKLAEMVRMQMKAGIGKFKCATLAEAEMLGKENAGDILLAIQPVGPEIARYVQLAKAFPDAMFSVVVDDAEIIRQLNRSCAEESIRLGAFLDINVGMNRTGVLPGPEAIARYKLLHEMPFLDVRGLHVYDGHIFGLDPDARTKRVDNAFAPVRELIFRLEQFGFFPPQIVAGGSSSFPVHARREGVELSPGTTLLWDFKNLDHLTDLPFNCAALLLTRVVSKPAPQYVCFDLGHKAVASEMPHPRVRLIGLEDVEYVGHSEEHLVAKTDRWDDIRVGDAYLGIPNHICPTVALYDHVNIVENDRVTKRWTVAARYRYNTCFETTKREGGRHKGTGA